MRELSIAITSFFFACTLLLALPAPATSQPLLTPEVTERAKQSIVFIYFDKTNAQTGERTSVTGTGFIVAKNGYVITASHLFKDWIMQNDTDRRSNPIWGSLRDKPGFVTESPLVLQIVFAGDPNGSDLKLLKLPDPSPREYSPANICFRAHADIRAGGVLFAFGFPLGQHFQPTMVTLGSQNADGGRWAAASQFTYGMSGGPVLDEPGFVVGVVKGGVANTEAVRWITPITFAKPLLIPPFEETRAAYPVDQAASQSSRKTSVTIMSKGNGAFRYRLTEVQSLTLPSDSLCSELGTRNDAILVRAAGAKARFWVKSKSGDIMYCQRSASGWHNEWFDRDQQDALVLSLERE